MNHCDGISREVNPIQWSPTHRRARAIHCLQSCSVENRRASIQFDLVDQNFPVSGRREQAQNLWRARQILGLDKGLVGTRLRVKLKQRERKTERDRLDGSLFSGSHSESPSLGSTLTQLAQFTGIGMLRGKWPKVYRRKGLWSTPGEGNWGSSGLRRNQNRER